MSFRFDISPLESRQHHRLPSWEHPARPTFRGDAMPHSCWHPERCLSSLEHSINTDSAEATESLGRLLAACGYSAVVPSEMLFFGSQLKKIPGAQQKLIALSKLRLVDFSDNPYAVSTMARVFKLPLDAAMGMLEEGGGLSPILRKDPHSLCAGNTILHALVSGKTHTMLEAVLRYIQLDNAFADVRNVGVTDVFSDSQSFLNAKGSAGYTALHYACFNMDATAARLLTAAGADTSITDDAYRSAKVVAKMAANSGGPLSVTQQRECKRQLSAVITAMVEGQVDAVWNRRRWAVCGWEAGRKQLQQLYVESMPASPARSVAITQESASPSSESFNERFLSRTVSYDQLEENHALAVLPMPIQLIALRSQSTLVDASQDHSRLRAETGEAPMVEIIQRTLTVEASTEDTSMSETFPRSPDYYSQMAESPVQRMPSGGDEIMYDKESTWFPQANTRMDSSE